MMLIKQAFGLNVPKRFILFVNAIFLTFVFASMGAASPYPQEFTDPQLEFFENKVRPLLVEKCHECHGTDAEPLEGGLSVMSREALLNGGETGPAIVPGHPEDSLLIGAINYDEVYEMPPDTKMSEEDIAVFEKWVEMGAPWPQEASVDTAPEKSFDLLGRRDTHWCWDTIKTVSPPQVSNEGWIKDPLDRFILHRLEQVNLNPARPADRRALIRRLYFDIIGLPPTPTQIKAYLENASPDATAAVIDELLASPRFGERWARHWMDLIRYAETCGHEFDYPLTHAHQYRDYLIRAFNADVPYNDFIREHLSGDLLTTPRRHPEKHFNESILGTGFWFLGESTHAPVDVLADEAGRIDNQIDVMTKTFLGLTVACARCHDHKFDAISTADYYALSGYLQSSRRQLAMLDPDQKIRQARQESHTAIEHAQNLFPHLQAQISSLDPTITAKTIESAMIFLRNDPTWNQPTGLKIQGESLKPINRPSGTNRVQELAPTEKFKWEGNKQFLWIDGKDGDQIDFDLVIPDSGHPTFQATFNIHFTQAVDYADLQVLLDDQPIGPVHDLYAPEITSELKEIGLVTLSPGKHKFSLRISGKNKSAETRYGVGIDYLEFKPILEVKNPGHPTIQWLSKKNGISNQSLERWVTALKSESLKHPTHPFHHLQNATRKRQIIDQNYAQSHQVNHQNQQKQFQQYLEQSTEFEAFDQGIPRDWFTSGQAFNTGIGIDSVSAGDAAVMPMGVVTSSRYGRPFYGVLYSPTFEIGTDQIHIRARGDSVSIRVIIDGFFMDVYNGLLFNGCRTRLDSANEFRWYTLGGDLRNYQGHRAHLEIIDHGSGFADIDEIRFANRNPLARPNPVVSHLASDSPQDLSSLARSFADYIIQKAPGRKHASDSDALSFLIENELLEPQTNINATKPSLKKNEWCQQFNHFRNQATTAAQLAPAPKMAIAMIDGTPEDQSIFVRGNHKTLGKVAHRRILEALEPEKRQHSKEQGSGRLQLANKIANPSNPLTSRVAVNRIWHHMMGRGIVGSVDNFGVLGQTPSHPQLLDYLAQEFTQDDWSVKRMIRRIAMSQTYQMASDLNPKANDLDPTNRLLHRARIKRLQGEVIRDSMLSCSNEIDLIMEGPSVPIFLTSFMSGRGRPGRNGPLDGANRRSVYIEVRRNFLSPMMLAFDTPIPFNSIGRRNQSNVPAQALILMNDPFVIDQANKWGAKIAQSNTSREERISLIYMTTVGREPTPEELENTQQFLAMQGSERGLKSPESLLNNPQIWADLCHVMFNVKEFIYIY
ncbi:MAG: PSD1 and planctomycete cytochrome C domain-containing protein [Mariniblastus sp.]|nr:PSD1 and planctomycete cytochrome C domain-containing protein [Mariniblastus sp.]